MKKEYKKRKQSNNELFSIHWFFHYWRCLTYQLCFQ